MLRTAVRAASRGTVGPSVDRGRSDGLVDTLEVAALKRALSSGAPEPEGGAMRVERFTFGSLRIDGVAYQEDVVIDGGRVRKRRKKPSQQFRNVFGHTPLSVEENIPWNCRRLVVGTGAHGALPVMDEVRQEAMHRNVELLILPTAQAIEALRKESDGTNAILHVTC